MQRRHIFWGDPHSPGERLQKIAVVAKAAQTACLRYRMSVSQRHLGMRDAFRDDILVDGRSGGILKNPAQIGAADVKMGRQYRNADALCQVPVDIVQYLVDLRVA